MLMSPRVQILASAQAQFPSSASKTVLVANAFRREDVTGEGGSADGWTPIQKPATAEVISWLRRNGYSKVSLSAGNTANPFRDVAISVLT